MVLLPDITGIFNILMVAILICVVDLVVRIVGRTSPVISLRIARAKLTTEKLCKKK